MLGDVRGGGAEVEADRAGRDRDGEDEREGTEAERPPRHPLPALPQRQQRGEILIEVQLFDDIFTQEKN